MSEGEEAISLSDAESEGDGPNIRPPQPSASILAKHKQKKRKRSRDSSKHKRRSADGRPRERKKSGGRGEYDRRRDRDRSRNELDSRRDREEPDLRHKIVRERYDRDRDRDRYSRDAERRHYDRDIDKRRDRNPEQEERKNRFLVADKIQEEKRKEAEARKRTKQLEKEMERLHAMLKHKKAAQRSRSGSRSRSHKKKKKRKKSRSESSAADTDEEMEVDENKDSESGEEAEDGEEAEGSTEEEEEDSEEESESDEGSDSTASQKSEETPEHEDNTSEDGEVEDDEEDKKLEELAGKVDKKVIKDLDSSSKTSDKEDAKSLERSPPIEGKWAEKSLNGTPSRSPTPLRAESDHTPGAGSGPGSRIQSPAVGVAAVEQNLESPPLSPTPLKDELPPYLPSVNGCRDVAEFKCMNRIEEGTYGVVYRALDKRTQEIVALKRLKMEREKEGFPITSLREINTLLISQHPNVVTVREIVVGSNMDQIFIVMDFVHHDLKSLMETMRKKNQVFLTGEVKCLMLQLLRAIAHLHDNWILHRDLKASNLLLSHKGILKVGDFGLAREYGSPLKAYTSVVVTLWYRAPELLLGTKEYSTHIDVWSIGCIFGELLLMEPLFPGKSEVDELNRIFKLLGTPSETVWPGYKMLPGVQKMKFVDFPISHLRDKFPDRMLSEEGISLLKSLLCYDPKRRATCDSALRADYFREDPRPIDPSMFPTWPAKSEQEPGDKVKKIASPKPPSGGMAFKNMGDDDEDRAKGFSPPPGFTLKF